MAGAGAQRFAMLPATYFQRLHWWRSEGGRSAHNVQLRWRLRGRLDVGRVRGALDALVARHEALRSGLRSSPTGVVQVVDPAAAILLDVVDLTRAPSGKRWRVALTTMRREVERPFQLADPPLTRAMLVRLGGRDHLLLVTGSHAMWDGWSGGVAFRDFGRLYAGRGDELPALRLQFADHVPMLQDAGEDARRHWADVLATFRPIACEWRTGDLGPRYAPAGREWPVASRAVMRALDGVSRASGATTGMTLVAAFGHLVAERSGRSRSFVAINDVNRDEPSSHDLIGCFLNFLVIGVDDHGDLEAPAQIARCRRAIVDAYRHRAELDVQVPLAEHRPADHRRPVVNDFWINFFPTRSGLASPGGPYRAGELTITALEPLGGKDARWNDGVLGLTLIERRDGALSGLASYDAAAIAVPTVERLCASYTSLLRGIAARPSRPMREMPVA